MHQGVGRLLLDSEIRGGSIDPRATRRTAFVIAGGHALTARHCSSDATPRDLLWLRLPSPGDEFGIVDLPVRVVDEDAALDALNREAYLPNLAMLLNNHALQLAELGRPGACRELLRAPLSLHSECWLTCWSAGSDRSHDARTGFPL